MSRVITGYNNAVLELLNEYLRLVYQLNHEFEKYLTGFELPQVEFIVYD